MKRKVLFLSSTGLHGVMAEALLNKIDSEHFEAVSASTTGRSLHRLTLEVMKEIGVDVSRKTPKSIQEFRGKEFDYVIAFGDCARLEEPTFRDAELLLWRFEEPSVESGDPERQLRTLRMIRDQIAQRLHLFVLVLARPVREA